MDVTRSLSLALMIVVPLIMAKDIQDYSLEETFTDDHLKTPSAEEPMEGWGHSEEDFEELVDWSRRKRALDTAGEVLETAEQVLFNPFVRQRQFAQNQNRGNPPRVADQQGSASAPQYVFRGTPFGAVFVKHQIDSNPQRKQR